MQGEPLLMLWAWETPEDLRTVSPQRAGVAFLAREVLLDRVLTVRPRRQPLLVAPNTFLMADVRIETGPNFIASSQLASQAAQAILEAAHEPNVRALQIDFDATASQRDFYAEVLHQLHTALPASFPLSITALASWCGPHSWLHALPIDEAVPMFFRMGGPAATRASAPRSTHSLAEPFCLSSVGVATDEAWPAIAPQQRVYVFRVGPWSAQDLANLNRIGYQGLDRFVQSPSLSVP